jgi:hypothetical protein
MKPLGDALRSSLGRPYFKVAATRQRWCGSFSAALQGSISKELSRLFLHQVEQCATRDSLQFAKRRSSTACTLDHSFGNVFPLLMATAIW